MKGAIALVLLMFPALLSAQIVETLKNAPASRYEVGKLQLRMALYDLADRLEGQTMGNSAFRLDGFTVEERGGRLQVIARLSGPAANVDMGRCQNITLQIAQREGLRGIARQIWPNLSEDQYRQLNEHIAIGTRLVAADDRNNTVQCGVLP